MRRLRVQLTVLLALLGRLSRPWVELSPLADRVARQYQAWVRPDGPGGPAGPLRY